MDLSGSADGLGGGDEGCELGDRGRRGFRWRGEVGRESGGGGGSEMVFEDGYGGGVEGLEGRRGGKGEAAKLHHNPMEEKKRRVVGKQHTWRRSPTRVRP